MLKITQVEFTDRGCMFECNISVAFIFGVRSEYVGSDAASSFLGLASEYVLVSVPWSLHSRSKCFMKSVEFFEMVGRPVVYPALVPLAALVIPHDYYWNSFSSSYDQVIGSNASFLVAAP